MRAVSYPTRQRNQRLGRALNHAWLAIALLLLAAAAARAGFTLIALLFLLSAVVAGVRSHHWLRLARRSSIGARSEQEVRAQLQALEREGWRIQHSLAWRGGGDVDHLAIAPPGVGLAFAIETKTRTYAPGDLARITAIARWLGRRGSGYSRQGAVPILCLAGARGVERWEAGVTVVSADCLVPVLSRLAGTTPKPAFLR